MKDEIQYKPGDRVYIVANNVSVKEFEIISVQDEYCTLRDMDRYGAIRLRKSRLYKTRKLHTGHYPKVPRIMTEDLSDRTKSTIIIPHGNRVDSIM